VDTKIIVTATDGSETTESVEITVTIKNPCVLPSYVEIVAPADFGTLLYGIDTGSFALEAHAAFTVETSPVENHSLCGALTFTAKYDGALLPPSDSLTTVTYDPVNRQFTIESTNGDLSGETKTISVTAEFANYSPSDHSTVSTDDASGTIQFLNPCLDPFEFTTSS
jgi:hypothetical protein